MGHLLHLCQLFRVTASGEQPLEASVLIVEVALADTMKPRLEIVVDIVTLMLRGSHE